MKSGYLKGVLNSNELYKSSVIFRDKDFKYTFIHKSGIYAVFIFDQDDNQISLTNAIDEVCTEILKELINLKKIPLGISTNLIRFFAYGTDEIWAEPKLIIDPKNSVRVRSWEIAQDSDVGWKMVFLLG